MRDVIETSTNDLLAQAHERWTKEELEQVDEHIAVLKEMGDMDDEVADEESYRESLIEKCPNLKVSI
jgi:hypothetical protein